MIWLKNRIDITHKKYGTKLIDNVWLLSLSIIKDFMTVSRVSSEPCAKPQALYIPPQRRPGYQQTTRKALPLPTAPTFSADEPGFHTPPSSSQSCPQLPPPLKLTPLRVQVLTRPLPEDSSHIPYAEIPWCQHIIEKITELADLSHKRATVKGDKGLTDREIATLRDTIDQQNITNPKELLIVLKLLAGNPFCGMEPIFYDVLKKIRDALPQLDDYMTDILGNEHEGPVLTATGVGMLINFFKIKYKFSDEALSCASTSQLPELIKDLIESREEGKAVGWVIYPDDPDDKHMVPVFAIYQNDKVHVFIFDSQGHDINPQMPRISTSLYILRQYMKPFANQIQLYSYKSKRQNGNVECSIFSLQDLKCLLEMHASGTNLIQYYQEQPNPSHQPRLITPEMLGETHRKGLPFYELSMVPVGMMKPTQSIRTFEALKETDQPTWVPYTVCRTNAEGELIEKAQTVADLYAQVQKYTSYNSDGDARNLYALQKRLSYIIYMIVQILERPELPVPELLPNDDTWL